MSEQLQEKAPEATPKNENYFVVAITRTCGSGGGSIGKALAAAYDIDLYDRKLLRLAAEDSGINEAVFAQADEITKKSLLYRASKKVYNGEFIPPESGNFLSDKNLFNYQAKILRELCDTESYVCIGRAADFVLADKPNVLRIYVDAPYQWRINHEMERQGISCNDAIHYIDKLDKYRNSYYTYHTGRKWKRPDNYDLCIDTSRLGIENSVKLVQEYIRLKFGAMPL